MIKSKYHTQFPGDYVMKRKTIEAQVESYIFLRDHNLPDIPYDISNMIKNRYRSSYPDDYTMQRALVEKDIRLYLRKTERP